MSRYKMEPNEILEDIIKDEVEKHLFKRTIVKNSKLLSGKTSETIQS
jgi:hypothetical protein